MAKDFIAKEICEKALRKIGAFSINDSAADPDELAEALDWLDLSLGHLGGTGRVFFLVPATVTLELTGGTGEYDLNNELSDELTLGFQFPIEASLRDDGGNDSPIKIMTRDEYEAIPDKDTSGSPTSVYIDRLGDPTLFTYPVLGSGETGVSIRLVVQTYSKDYAGTNGNLSTDLRKAWQMWAIYEVASHIAGGPIRRVPDSEIAGIRKMAENLKEQLLAYENRSHATRGGTYQRVAYRDF